MPWLERTGSFDHLMPINYAYVASAWEPGLSASWVKPCSPWHVCWLNSDDVDKIWAW